MDKKSVLPGRSSDLRIVLRLHLPVPNRNSGISQSSSPLTALAQRYGFAPYSLFTAEFRRHLADMSNYGGYCTSIGEKSKLPINLRTRRQISCCQAPLFSPHFRNYLYIPARSNQSRIPEYSSHAISTEKIGRKDETGCRGSANA